MNSKLNNFLNYFKNPDVLFKLAVIVFLTILLNESQDYPDHSRLFPQIVTIFGLVIVVLSLGKDMISEVNKKVEEQNKSKKSETKLRFFKTVVVIIIAFLISLIGGILFVVPAAYLCYFSFFGRREIAGRIFFITVMVTLIAYGIFKMLFKIPVLNF